MIGRRDADTLDRLSTLERDVLGLVAERCSDRRMAEKGRRRRRGVGKHVKSAALVAARQSGTDGDAAAAWGGTIRTENLRVGWQRWGVAGP